jgi:hypothetical protein
MLLVTWRTADTAVATAVGLMAASFTTFRAAGTHLRIDPFLTGMVGRVFTLALIWVVVFSVCFTSIYWPYAELFS